MTMNSFDSSHYKNFIITRNQISYLDLLKIHVDCDDDFIPRLSSRVNVSEYCKKLLDNAEIIGIYVNHNLVGVVAMYCNNIISKEAFISSICISKNFRGLGYGKILLKEALSMAKSKKFTKVLLEVGKNNFPAISLYTRFGFYKIKEGISTIYMQCDI